MRGDWDREKMMAWEVITAKYSNTLTKQVMVQRLRSTYEIAIGQGLMLKPIE